MKWTGLALSSIARPVTNSKARDKSTGAARMRMRALPRCSACGTTSRRSETARDNNGKDLQPSMDGAPIRTFHLSFITGPASHNRLLKNLALLLAGAAIAAGYSAFLRRRHNRRAHAPPGDAVVGAQVLETRAAVDRLLQS